MSELRPVLVADLFPELRKHLLKLLHSLEPAEWELPTAAKLWNVKDIALHLLGGDLGILSRKRDGFTPGGASIAGWNDLVTFINQLNQTWLDATRRLSTQVLCDLLAFTGPQVETYFAALDPFAMADKVSWGCDPQWKNPGRGGSREATAANRFSDRVGFLTPTPLLSRTDVDKGLKLTEAAA